MKKIFGALGLVCLVLLFATSIVAAQGSELQVMLSRTMGFSLGKQIQGAFTISAVGPADLTSVTFLIDGKEMATVNQAPFRYSFSTDSYAVGAHQFSATAKTASGKTMQANAIDVEIVTASAGWQSASRIIFPILGIVGLVMVLMVVLQTMPFGRAKRRFGEDGAMIYGVAGGAICPKCGRPFARSIFGINMIAGKLERCPYCGKWSITRAARPEALRAAEQLELAGAKPVVHELTAEERLRQQIEESKAAR